MDGWKKIRVIYPYEFEGVMKSILKKYQAEVIHKNFGKKIDIQLYINIELANEFINSVNELSSGSTQIITED